MLPRPLFSPEHELFRDQVRRFVADEIVRHHARWEDDGRVPREVWRAAGGLGLLGCTLPETYGGAGGDAAHAAVVIEELARVNASGPGFVAQMLTVQPLLLAHGDEAQARRWLPALASGRAIGALAVCEPDGLSDADAIATRLERRGPDLVLTGRKSFVTNGGAADLIIVAARGPGGLALVLVEGDRPGLVRGDRIKMVGLRAHDVADLTFDGVTVPAANLLVPEGGAAAALQALQPWEWLGYAIAAAATGEAALGWTIDYTRQRHAFGRPIFEFQNTRFGLAQLKTDLAAARAVVDEGLGLMLAGRLDAATAAIAKTYCTELLGRVTDAGVQFHGGYGFMWDYPITRAYADGRALRFLGGAEELLKERIAAAVLDGAMERPRPLFKPEHEAFRAKVRDFYQREIVPHIAEWEDDGCISRDAWTKAGAAGLLCLRNAPGYGGAGLDQPSILAFVEEQARAVSSGPGFHLPSGLIATYIEHYGSAEQKGTWLPRMARGEAVGCICMTEPNTGSDLQAIRTTALRDGDEWVVDGHKMFISGGWQADIIIVAAKTDPREGAKGISLILVEADRPGVTRSRRLNKLGLKASDTVELFFDGVRVPAANLLGEEGQGFYMMMAELAWERAQLGARNLAVAEAIQEHTVAALRRRRPDGRAIADHQHARIRLAEAAAQVRVGRIFVDRCLELVVRDELDPVTAAMGKLWSSEMLGRVLDTFVQLQGAAGYVWSNPTGRAFADARVQRIQGGTSEIMTEIIARSL